MNGRRTCKGSAQGLSQLTQTVLVGRSYLAWQTQPKGTAPAQVMSKIAPSDPNRVTSQLLGCLGKCGARMQLLYQASTEGWLLGKCLEKLATSYGGNLLLVARLESGKIVAAYTALQTALQRSREGHWKDSPSSILVSLDGADSITAPRIYMERPLERQRAYYMYESSPNIIPDTEPITQGYSIDLPAATAYTVEFAAGSKVGADNDIDLSYLRFYGEKPTKPRPGGVYGGLLGIGDGTDEIVKNKDVRNLSIPSKTLTVKHVLHPGRGPCRGYAFTAWSNFDTRGRVCWLNRSSIAFGTSIAFGNNSDCTRLQFDVDNRVIIEPADINCQLTAAGYEVAPGKGCICSFTGGTRTAMTELEVWLVEDVPASGELPDATHPIVMEPKGQMITRVKRGQPMVTDEEARLLWGEIDINRAGLEADKAFAIRYKPEHLERVNILLCGGVGAGKSTIINSFLSVFNDEVVEIAMSAQRADTVTTTVTRYALESIRSDIDGPVTTNIVLWDSPGFTYAGNVQTYKHNQLTHIISGAIPDGFEDVDSREINILDTPGVNKNPTAADKMHVVMLFVHYKHLEEKRSPYLIRIQEFIQRITNKASPWTKTLQPMLIVSHVDQLDDRVNSDKSMLFRSALIQEYLQMAADLTGLPLKVIFPVTGYHRQRAKDMHLDRLLVHILRKALSFADAHFYNLRKQKLIGPGASAQP